MELNLKSQMFFYFLKSDIQLLYLFQQISSTFKVMRLFACDWYHLLKIEAYVRATLEG